MQETALSMAVVTNTIRTNVLLCTTTGLIVESLPEMNQFFLELLFLLPEFFKFCSMDQIAVYIPSLHPSLITKTADFASDGGKRREGKVEEKGS